MQTKMASVNLMADQQHDALAAASELLLFDEKGLEVVGTKGLAANATALLDSWSARDELDVLGVFYGSSLGPRENRLDKSADRTGGRVVVVPRVAMAGSKHAKVVGVDEGVMMARTVELPLGGGGSQGLAAGRAFGKATDFEPLRGGVANNDRVSMATGQGEVSSGCYWSSSHG